MNFLLKHSFSSSDLPLVSELEKENRPSSETGGSLQTLLSTDSVVDDVRSAGGSGGGGADVWRTRNRMVLEDHVDVPSEDGGVLIPSRELTGEWESNGDMKSLSSLDRSFVFPGEQLHIVVYLSSHDQSVPEIITPFKVAALMTRAGLMSQNQADGEGDKCSTITGDSDRGPGLSDGSAMFERQECGGVEGDASSLFSEKSMLPVTESLLRMEGHKKRSALLLESFQKSHFFVRIAGADEPLWRKRTAFDRLSENFDKSENPDSRDKPEQGGPITSRGAIPVVIEGEKFDPKMAGGVARKAVACHSFANGDIAVVLQVTIATDLMDDALLEVLQFEHPQNQGIVSAGVLQRSSSNHSGSVPSHSDPSDQLLQWLLPLDRPSSPPPPLFPLSTPASLVNNSPQRISSASSSSLFSFGSLRSSSVGLSQNTHYLVTSTLPHPLSNYGSEEWDRLASQKSYKGQDVGSEGLLSFRGAQLEPQRFSVNCGLEGLYVPGKRWRRKLEILQPVAIESYVADCNTEDLICVLIENVVPVHIPGVVMIVDSISIICQSAGPSNLPLYVSMACVEVGEDHKLPGLLLRPGEQHSFIVKPTSSTWRSPVLERDKIGNMGSVQVHESQTTNNTTIKTFAASVFGPKTMEEKSSSHQECGSYALVVSCRCSHTESRLYFKHSIQWRPRVPRDLLLSVALEPSTNPVMPNGTIPQLLSQVLTVQATNLTSDDLNLTLLAPSFTNSTPSIPTFYTVPLIPRMNSFLSFCEEKNGLVVKEGEIDKEKYGSVPRKSKSASLQRSLSLPPAKPIESIMGMSPRVVKERAISAAEIAAENKSARTHLWLQSTVPLGCVPAQSTTAVRCELLPLTDGIITMDTLHISTKDRDVLYLPERPLQIYALSSLASGLS